MSTIKISFLNLRLSALFTKSGNFLLNPLNMTVWILGTEKVISLGYPIPSPGERSRPRNWTRVSCTADGFSTSWAIRKAWRKRGNCNYSKGAVFHSSSFLGALTRPLPPGESSISKQPWKGRFLINRLALTFKNPREEFILVFHGEVPHLLQTYFHPTPPLQDADGIVSPTLQRHVSSDWFHLCFTFIQF